MREGGREGESGGRERAEGGRERREGGRERREGRQFLYSLCILVSPLCVVLVIFLRYNKPPHWVMQIFLMIGAFVMSVAWLNVIANEVVSILQALGLIAGISTGKPYRILSMQGRPQR